ncbi:MAG: exodeoxyribonuclease VII large subunit [Pseudomonadales bacterium]|nr:exodeoxyribonuclease VII large subunit [Pseudomonadales bacterium]
MPSPDILSVTSLNTLARDLLEGQFANLNVEGEISNLTQASSGHLYFTLKDAQAQVRAAMFRSRRQSLRLHPVDGMKVQVHGHLSLYTPRGDYQLIVENMVAAGAGDLQAAFIKLKEKLAAEGLFTHKRPLPHLPTHVALITSRQGAVLHDVLSILKRRYPALPVTLMPVLVQGEQAAAMIIHMLNRIHLESGFDVVLICRGGGSMEDLWAFNDEALARAIRACPIPVISAVGHETDFTIADFAADLRAATPSAAAEILSEAALRLHQQLQQLAQRIARPPRQIRDQEQRLDQLQLRLMQAWGHLYRHCKEQIQQYVTRLQSQHPRQQLYRQQEQLDTIFARLKYTLERSLTSRQHAYSILKHRFRSGSTVWRLNRLHENLFHQINQLRSMMPAHLQQARTRLKFLAHRAHIASPLTTLSRGYAILEGPRGIIRQADDVQTGDKILARLHEGSLSLLVLDTEKGNS